MATKPVITVFHIAFRNGRQRCLSSPSALCPDRSATIRFLLSNNFSVRSHRTIDFRVISGAYYVRNISASTLKTRFAPNSLIFTHTHTHTHTCQQHSSHSQLLIRYSITPKLTEMTDAGENGTFSAHKLIIFSFIYNGVRW